MLSLPLVMSCAGQSQKHESHRSTRLPQNDEPLSKTHKTKNKKGKRMQRSRHVFKNLQNRWPLEAVTGGGPDEQGVSPTFSNL